MVTRLIRTYVFIGICASFPVAALAGVWDKAMVRHPARPSKPPAAEPDDPNPGPPRSRGPGPLEIPRARRSVYLGYDAQGVWRYSTDRSRLASVTAELPVWIESDGRGNLNLADPY